jgi:hypothetical protein
MSELSNGTKKQTSKSRETIPLTVSERNCQGRPQSPVNRVSVQQ